MSSAGDPDDPAGSPRPVNGLRVWRRTALVVVVSVLLFAPLWHFLGWSSHRAAVECDRRGHVVTVTDPRDVRVEVTENKFTLDVSEVDVRVDGAWREVRDSAQYQPNEVRAWYVSTGTQPPVRGTAQYPPLVVRACPDPNGVMFEKDVRRELRESGNPPAAWVLDAAAVLIAVELLRRCRRWWRRGMSASA